MSRLIDPVPLKKSLGPLRKIVKFFVGEYGQHMETLECGHTIPRKKDLIGYTNAYKRRCRHCKNEGRMEIKINIEPCSDGMRASMRIPSGTEVTTVGKDHDDALIELLEVARGQILHEKRDDAENEGR